MGKQDEARERVLDLIESLTVGQPIPPERQLCVQLGVSRLTLRAALDQLVEQGYLVRRQGSGTFVSEPKIAQQLALTSFTEDMRRRGMVPSSRSLEFVSGPAGPRIARKLQISPDDRALRIRRLRLADGQTMAIEKLSVAEALVPGLTAQDLEGRSFYEILQQRYGVVVARGFQTIEPTVTNDEESADLGVPLHSPALLFERTTYTEAGRIIEFVQSIYRGDRYQLVAELTPTFTRVGRNGPAQLMAR